MSRNTWLFILAVVAATPLGAQAANITRSPRFLVASSEPGKPPSVIDPALLPLLQRLIAPFPFARTRRDAIDAISRATGLQFVYETQSLMENRAMRVRTDSAPLATALSVVLDGTGLDVIIAANGTVVLNRGTLRAQVIRGRVMSNTNVPIVDAGVIITMAPSREIFRDTTDAAGQYSISIPDGSGDFLVFISALGRASFRKRVTGSTADSLFVVDAVLAPAAPTLPTVRTVATRNRPPRSDEDRRWDTGDGSVSPVLLLSGALSPDQLGDINAMAATAPGIVMTPEGPSAFGLEPSQNRVFLNGLPIDGTNLPRGLMTTTTVMTNLFDPTVGGFGGAGVNVMIQPGSLYPAQDATLSLDAPQLQSGGMRARLGGQRFSDVDVSYTRRGELMQDLWVYNSGIQVRRRSAYAASLLEPGVLLLPRDSIARFMALANQSGLPTARGDAAGDVLTSTIVGAFRADKAPAYEYGGLMTTASPRLGIIGQGSWSHNGRTGAFETAVPSHSGSHTEGNASLQLNYSRYFGPGRYHLNETRTSVSVSGSRDAPFLSLPESRVRVTDDLGNIATFTAGGSSHGESSMVNWTWASLSEFQFNPSNWLKHRLKVAVGSDLSGYDMRAGTDAPGLFTFSTLSDFAANRPASFTRTTYSPSRVGGGWVGSFAIADYYTYSPTLSLTFGPRIEASVFTSSPVGNPALAAALATRTDVSPSALHVSPRLGFRWLYLDPRRGGRLGGTSMSSPMGYMLSPPKGVLTGGIGEFRSTLRNDLLAEASANTGVAGMTARRLSCVGNATPVPDFHAYATDESAIPAQCRDGSPTQLVDVAPGVRTVEPGYDAARSWRANLMWASAKSAVYYSINATYALNLNQAGVVDVNFAGDPRFTLADEASRPVFVDPTSIVSTTGAVSPTNARIVNAFGSVLSQRSDLRSVTRQLRVNVSPYLASRIGKWSANVNYTWQDMRAQRRGFDGTTDGDPRRVDWASGPTPSHMLQAQVGYAFSTGAKSYVSLTSYTRITSGFRYTPLIAGDINGDGFLNDRPFVFDPSHALTPTAAAEMRSLLATAPPAARDCLVRQLGQIAERNSCRQPHGADLNLLAQWSHRFGQAGRQFQLALNFHNPLAGLDQLMHGSGSLHGWGAHGAPDPVLLLVNSFDATARRFQYQVNPRFGDVRSAMAGTQNPFRVSLFATFNLTKATPELRTQRLLRPTRGAPGLRPHADTILTRMTSGVGGGRRSSYYTILAMSDSLLLSPEQVVAIRTAALQESARSDSTARALAKYLSEVPDGYDLAAVTAVVTAAQAAMNDGTRELSTLREILTPLQRRLSSVQFP